jgi:hypothetical protein
VFRKTAHPETHREDGEHEAGIRVFLDIGNSNFDIVSDFDIRIFDSTGEKSKPSYSGRDFLDS